MLKSLLKKKAAVPPAAIPAGDRVYAIGDVHGRLDCLDALIASIDADSAARDAADVTIVFIGDLIDRGPESRGVVDRVMEMVRDRPRVRLLMGNHEEILLRSAKGERQTLSLFDKVGGRETLLSYGVDAETYDHADLETLALLILQAVPAAHRDFLADGEAQVIIGGYTFVHAGLRPGVPLAEQRGSDLRWIREPFLGFRGDHGTVVVHGHTITDAPELLTNRIGIDTGAFDSGCPDRGRTGGHRPLDRAGTAIGPDS